jgi:hypothetical protein
VKRERVRLTEPPEEGLYWRAAHKRQPVGPKVHRERLASKPKITIRAPDDQWIKATEADVLDEEAADRHRSRK